MEEIEKMGRYYTAMLKTICGDDYDKVKAASYIAAVEQEDFCPNLFRHPDLKPNEQL